MDFNRTSLGVGIPIKVAEVDLGVVIANELQQLRAAFPQRRLELQLQGDLRGCWDGARLQQVLRNLVSNATVYGTVGEPVLVAVRGDETGVGFDVTNQGPIIEPDQLEQLFNPLVRGVKESREAYAEGLGLGLYIVREITTAHGGKVTATSDAEGTVFSVRLPRKSTDSALDRELDS